MSLHSNIVGSHNFRLVKRMYNKLFHSYYTTACVSTSPEPSSNNLSDVIPVIGILRTNVVRRAVGVVYLNLVFLLAVISKRPDAVVTSPSYGGLR